MTAMSPAMLAETFASIADALVMECYRTGTAIVVADTDQRNNRWNRFLTEAKAARFGSPHSVPLRVRETTVGAVTVLCTECGTLSPQDSRIAIEQAKGMLAERHGSSVNLA
jgi:Autoinducer binding domain